MRLTYASLADALINGNESGGIHVDVSLGSFGGKMNQNLLSFSQRDFSHRMKAVLKTWFLGHVHDGIHFAGFVSRGHFHRNGFPPVGMGLISNAGIELSVLGGFQSKSSRAAGIAGVAIAKLEIRL